MRLVTRQYGSRIRRRAFTRLSTLPLALLALAGAALGPAGSARAVGDTTAPVIHIAVPVEGAHYALNANIASSFSCTDEAGGSGLNTCSGPPKVGTAGAGAHTFTVTATDNDGNHATRTVHYSVVDDTPVVTPPTIVVNTPAEGQHFAQDTAVTSAFTCTAGSGPGTPTCTGPATVDTTAEGPQTFSVTSSDTAGHSASKIVHYFVDAPVLPVNAPRPTISVASPVQGRHYAQNVGTTPSFSCGDVAGGGGIVSCSGPPKVDTATPGAHSYVVTAADAVGNTATQLVVYFVDPSPASIGKALAKTLRASSLRPDRSGAYTLTFAPPSGGRLSIVWRAHGTVIARTTTTFNTAVAKKVRIKLTTAGRRLRQAGRLRVVSRVSFTPEYGSAQSRTKTITLGR